MALGMPGTVWLANAALPNQHAITTGKQDTKTALTRTLQTPGQQAFVLAAVLY